MGLFEKKQSLQPYFKGFTDYHCHILPGVDDGFSSMEESLEVLHRYDEVGVSEVWLTPHIMEDVPNEPSALKERFELFKAAAQKEDIRVSLHLAAENMMDSLFEDRLAAGDVLPILGNHLLVETSYYNPPMDLEGVLSRVKSKGYFPILAHPERYIYMDRKDYDRLHEMGVKFQMNISSFAGLYGDMAKRKAVDLLKKRYYSFTGTDLHSARMLEALLDKPSTKPSELKLLSI